MKFKSGGLYFPLLGMLGKLPRKKFLFCSVINLEKLGLLLRSTNVKADELH